MTAETGPRAGNASLQRGLGLSATTLSGVGIILGAGIYVIIGAAAEVGGIDKAGSAAEVGVDFGYKNILALEYALKLIHQGIIGTDGIPYDIGETFTINSEGITVVIVVTAGLKSFDMNQELVARSLGASRARAFLLITLPQIRFSVITGALLAFLTSLDEVIIALFVSGGQNATITRRMFNALRDQIDPTIASISTCLIVVSVVLLVTAQIFGKERD